LIERKEREKKIFNMKKAQTVIKEFPSNKNIFYTHLIAYYF